MEGMFVMEKRLCVYVSFFKLEAGVLMLYLMQGLITLWFFFRQLPFRYMFFVKMSFFSLKISVEANVYFAFLERVT